MHADTYQIQSIYKAETMSLIVELISKWNLIILSYLNNNINLTDPISDFTKE